MATPPASPDRRSPPPDGGAAPWNEPPPASKTLPMILPVFILFFILVTFLSIFLFRDILYYISTAWFSRRRGRPAAAAEEAAQSTPADGLDPTILASFPTLPYSAVSGLQEGKCGKECAVCLSEFAAGDAVRLLTVCCHAFHPVCIDSWLAGHKTCPMCRSDLQGPPDEAAVMAVKEAVRVGGHDYAITVDDDR